MKKLILMLSILAISLASATAQTDSYHIEYSINGLLLGRDYTDAQMSAKLGGTPTRFQVQDSEFGGLREYTYGTDECRDVFAWSEQNGFERFSISSSNYSIFDGKIKVGLNISVFNQLGFGKLTKNSDGTYTFFFGLYGASVDIITDKNGKITTLYYAIPG